MNDIITEKLQGYSIHTADEELNALKEISQEIILYALSKTNFFEHTHFCGGTALRIIHRLNRFSEDLDFTTSGLESGFQFDEYIPEVILTLDQYGLDMQLKKSRDNTFVKARELKGNSDKWLLTFPANRQLKKVMIKLEVDTNPPAGAIAVSANLDFPILHQVKIGSIETLFAGKIHALLCRSFIKGRDWYDLLWYIKRSTAINYKLLKNALLQMGPYQGQSIDQVDRKFLIDELELKIKSLDWPTVRRDVERFIKPDELSALELWDENLFLEKIQKII